MSDPLLDRVRLAIEDSYLLRKERRACIDMRQQQIAELRLAVLESAMLRSEVRAYRDDRRHETRHHRARSD
jgi:hypothetical protein